jgi:uncharacterized protein YjbJ (UPF0337 family)
VPTHTSRSTPMKWDRIEASWPRLLGLAKQKWSRLDDERFHAIGGSRDRLLGWLQDQYGISLAEAELEVQEWETIVREWERRQHS